MRLLSITMKFKVIVTVFVSLLTVLICHTGADELASIDLSTFCGYGGELAAAKNFSLRWSIASSTLEWYNITAARSGETITITSENNPRFDFFVPIITDGVDTYITNLIIDDGEGTGYGLSNEIKYESDMFANKSGCKNGIDLQGNLVEAISLDVWYERRFSEGWCRNQTIPFFNFTITVLGRPLMRHEDALAKVIYGSWSHPCSETILFSLEVYEGLSWATIEFLVDLNKTQQGDTVLALREYGTHPIGQLLTNGIDGNIIVCNKIPVGQGGGCSTPNPNDESVVLKDQLGFTGVDLHGCYVINITLSVKELHTSSNDCDIRPEFIIAGSLGEPLPRQECPDECTSSDVLTTSSKGIAAALCFTLTAAGWLVS